MAKFHTLQVKDIYKDIDDCSVIEFDVPDDLKETFKFKQGQYLTLRTTINDEDIRRSYSLCSSPLENEWKVAVKQISEGKFSTFVNQTLKKGDTLQVMKPMGRFFVEVEIDKAKNYIAFVAGSGITPIISIIKTHLAKEPKSTFQLFYLSKNSNTIIFKNELKALVLKYGNRLKVFHFLTQEKQENDLFNGRVTSEKLKQITSEIININEVDECFLCGPEEMIFLVKDEFISLGLNSDKIHFELFEVRKNKKEIINIIDNAEVSITIDDEEYTFTIPIGKTILEVAEENDADVPFSCKGGVCCTCKAKVIEGSVTMRLNYGLDQDDLKNNIVLTCQAVPTSKKVVLDYDEVY
ncbi:MAG: 2Fe-2S iron-sulfur cluster-binding protein [Flavobacteriaceae bacterium]|nr:2Fe-2S iron-sulfur cluster-binding protein [Flavobacteriaceae bacterium]